MKPSARPDSRLPLTLARDPERKTFSVAEKNGPVRLDGLSGSIVVNGKLVGAADAPAADLEWQWDVKASAREVLVAARLRNTGKAAVTVGDWTVLQADAAAGGSVSLGPGDPAGTVFFRWSPWDMAVERLGTAEGTKGSTTIMHLTDPAARRTLLAGFVSLDRMGCRHEVRVAKGGGIAGFRSICFFGNYVLEPGRELVSERLVVRVHDDPHGALEQWADAVHDRYRPSFAALPPVGWCGWAWVDPFSPREPDWETTAVENAKAIRRRLKGFPVDYLWTSQANLKDAIPGNWLKADKRMLPSGLAGFFRKLRKLKFTPGLWVAPFWFYGEAEGVLEENRDNLLRGDDGQPLTWPSCWGWNYGDNLPWYTMQQYFLDGTHPKTAAFIRKVFATYRKLGVRYYMLDFLSIIENARRHRPDVLPLEAARDVMATLRATAGKGTHIQTAVSSTPAYVGVIDAARVGRDFGEGRPLQGGVLSDWRNATYVLHDQHYANTKALLQNVAANWFTHRKLYLNDFNLLTVDKPVPLEHARIAATVFGLGGTPIMLGDDYRRMDEERLRLVKLCLPRTAGMFEPVDLFERVQPGEYGRVLKLRVETQWESYVLAAVFNLDPEPRRIELNFEKLGFGAGAVCRVYEFWNGEYAGTYRDRVSCPVPAEACRLYRISERRQHPWLLSTDLHIQQGAVEVAELEWDARRRRLRGVVKRPAGESGNLVFLMPRKMRLVNHEGCYLLKELVDLNVIIRMPVEFRKGEARFDLRFEPWEMPCVSPRGLMPFSTEAEWKDYAERNRRPGDTRVFE